MSLEPALLFALVAMAGLSWLNWAQQRDLLYPGFLQSVLWFLVFLALAFAQQMFIQIPPAVYFLLVVAAVCFTLGCFLSTAWRRLPHTPWPAQAIERNGWVLDVLLAVCVAGFPLYLMRALEVGAAGPRDEFFFNLRHSTTEEIDIYGGTAYFGTVSVVAMGLFLVYGKGVARWKTLLMALVSLAYAGLSSGRTSLFLWILTVAGILAISRRVKPRTALALFIVFGVLAFSAVALGTGKGADSDEDFISNVRSIYDSFLSYFLSPVPAFGEYMTTERELGLGEQTLRFFSAVMERVGFAVKAPVLVQDPVSVPVIVNVYTYLQPYYADFGVAGIVFFPLLLGMAHGAVYVRAVRRGGLCIVAYGLLTYPLFLQFFQDQYFNLMSTWIQFGMVLGLVGLLTSVRFGPEDDDTAPVAASARAARSASEASSAGTAAGSLDLDGFYNLSSERAAPGLDGMAVVIVNWNTGALLRDCVASVLGASRGGGAVRRIVVVDNGSTDDSLALLLASPAGGEPLLRIERNETNRGFAAACNQGAQGADAEFLLFLNPDTLIDAQSVSVPLDFMKREAHDRVGVTSIRATRQDGRTSVTCARFPRLRHVLFQGVGLDRAFPGVLTSSMMLEFDHEETRPVDQVIGAFFVVRASLFRQLGGFDERFFVYFEEVDFCLRARQAGSQVYFLANASYVHHGGGSSSSAKADRLFYSLSSRAAYFRKHHSLAAWFTVIALSLTVEFAARIAASALSMTSTTLRDALSGYRRYTAAVPRLFETVPSPEQR